MNTMLNMVTAAAIALAVSGAPALAQQAGAQVEVSYADLNLSSKAGQDILERRIHHATQIVCGGPAEPNITFGKPVRECMKKATLDAMAARDLAVANYKAGRVALRDRKIRFAIR